MKAQEIIRQYLYAHGFDGLLSEEADCGCAREALVPCESDFSNCKPAFKVLCDCEDHEGYHYQEKKE